MPTLTVDHVISASLTPEIFSMPVDDQRLRAVTLYAVNDTAISNDIWSEIVIFAGGQTRQNIIAGLASGYIGAYAPNFWSGNIKTDLDTFIGGIVIGTSGEIVRLSAIFEKD